MANPRLTPLIRGKEVLGQEQIDNTTLPTKQEPVKPLRLRPASNTESLAPIMASPEFDSGFDVEYAELDRQIKS